MGKIQRMWTPRWLRRAIRRRMNPINEYDAVTWQMRLSFVYAFVAWNALGFVGYYIFSGRANESEFLGITLEDDKKKRPGAYYAELLNAPNPKIVKIEGFKITETIDYKPPDYEAFKKEEL